LNYTCYRNINISENNKIIKFHEKNSILSLFDKKINYFQDISNILFSVINFIKAQIYCRLKCQEDLMPTFWITVRNIRRDIFLYSFRILEYYLKLFRRSYTLFWNTRQLITRYTPITIVTEDREIRSRTHEVVEHSDTALYNTWDNASMPIVKSIIDDATLRTYGKYCVSAVKHRYPMKCGISLSF